MMNRDINSGQEKEGLTASYMNCDVPVSMLLAASVWNEANRLGWPLDGTRHSASQG